MNAPVPELPDDTPIESVLLPTRVSNALIAAGLKTVGEVRETSDRELLSLQNFGDNSLYYVRKMLGLASSEGVREKP